MGGVGGQKPCPNMKSLFTDLDKSLQHLENMFGAKCKKSGGLDNMPAVYKAIATLKDTV